MNSKRISVVIVDDNDIMRSLLRGILRGEAYDVIGEARNGNAAIERLRDRAARSEPVEGRGVAEGDLPARVDAPALASYCVTVLQGLSVRARDGCTRQEAHAVVDVAMAAWDAAAS